MARRLGRLRRGRDERHGAARRRRPHERHREALGEDVGVVRADGDAGVEANVGERRLQLERRRRVEREDDLGDEEAGVKREPLVEARLLVDAVEELGEGGALLGAQFHLPLRVHLVDEGRRLPPEEAARRVGLAGEGRLGELLVQAAGSRRRGCRRAGGARRARPRSAP